MDVQTKLELNTKIARFWSASKDQLVRANRLSWDHSSSTPNCSHLDRSLPLQPSSARLLGTGMVPLDMSFVLELLSEKKNEILEEVRKLLKDLNRWLRLQAGQPDNSNDYDGQDAANADAIAICRTAIEHQLPRVYAVWGLNEKDLLRLAKRCPKPMKYKDAAQTIFPKNDMATKFLNDGKAEFNASTAEMLSEAIKPFLDSSTSSFGGRKEFSTWPLVKGVHIYAKADIKPFRDCRESFPHPGCKNGCQSHYSCHG